MNLQDLNLSLNLRMRERIAAILSALKSGVYERDEAIALSLLSALSGESIFLLGLPGVGKSMIARRLKLAFKDAAVFEYLMSRFSTPDEIFGPVSISKLKDEDRYERMVAGYLPDAEVVFLDEIWKAGPAIQNALLTVLNEKVYLNGNQELRLPVKAIIAASNELPAEDEGLEALWDRFLVRYIVEPIREKDNFFRLICDEQALEPACVEYQPLSDEDYDRIRSGSGRVTLPTEIMELLYDLRQSVNTLPKMEDDDDVGAMENCYVSDRRWKKITGILRTSAFLNGREAVDMSDLLLLEFLLWDNDGMIPKLRGLISERIAACVFAKVESTFRAIAVADEKVKTGGLNLYSPDRIHYQILCDDFVLKLRIDDYERMQRNPKHYFFASETPEGALVIREQGQYTLHVSKPGFVCINSYNYPIVTTETVHLDHPAFRAVKEEIVGLVDKFRQSVKENMFTSGSLLNKLIDQQFAANFKRFGIKRKR